MAVAPAISYRRAVSAAPTGSAAVKFGNLESLSGKFVKLVRAEPHTSTVKGRVLFGDTAYGEYRVLLGGRTAHCENDGIRLDRCRR